jgi:hypothetical protein
MKLLLLAIIPIWLISSCGTLKELRPQDYIYKIENNKACYYKTIKDLSEGKDVICKDFKELDGWLIINADKLKEILTKGVDELIAIKNQSKPVPLPITK